MHVDQRAAVERVREMAGRKGVTVIPEWFYHNGEFWCDGDSYAVLHIESDRVAELTLTGALAKWLAGQGHGVIYSPWAEGWFHIDHHMDDADAETTEMWVTSGDYLSALIIAVLARLDELPDKEKA